MGVAPGGIEGSSREGGVWFGRALRLPLALALSVLVASEVLTDRFAAVQVAWWVPRSFLLAFAVAWILVLLALPWTRARRRERRAAWRWVVITAALALWTTPRDWRPFGPNRAGAALVLVHWNAGSPEESEADRAAEALLATGADIVLVTDPGRLWHGARGEALRAAGYTSVSGGRFGLASRLPVAEARPVLASRLRVVSRFVVATPAGPLALDGVDLPSAPTLPRALLTRTLAADLAELGHAPGDVLAGDFNISRGSASLANLAPDAVEAFGATGRGWGGSYPRQTPFWPIDLTLVRAPWRPVAARYLDLGVGRHRAQMVALERAE